MEYVNYFKRLMIEIDEQEYKSKEEFIEEYYSLILERQFDFDKKNNIVKNMKEFYERYCKNYIDERTFRRWRKNEPIYKPRDYNLDLFDKMTVIPALMKEKSIEHFFKNVANQDDIFLIRLLFELKNSQLKFVLPALLDSMKYAENLSRSEYLDELKSKLVYVIEHEL